MPLRQRVRAGACPPPSLTDKVKNKMKTYLIGYDLNKPGKDYTRLIQAIKDAFPTRWHELDSTWVVKTNLTAVQIRDRLKPPLIDNTDELLVVRLGGEWATSGVGQVGLTWLHNQMSYE